MVDAIEMLDGRLKVLEARVVALEGLAERYIMCEVCACIIPLGERMWHDEWCTRGETEGST